MTRRRAQWYTIGMPKDGGGGGIDLERLAACVTALREAVQGLEAVLTQAQEGKPPDPIERRRQLLERIYVQGGVQKPELLTAVREVGTAYQWIGQQVKMGYLEVPKRGETMYRVTHKAIRELELGGESAQDEAAYTLMAGEAFAEDWESEEDAIYDRL